MSHEIRRRVVPGRRIAVSELGFGGSAIGNSLRPVSPQDATGAVEAAWQHGLRYFDTAPHYGLGLSESRLGEALRDKPRSQYVISTKVGRRLVPNESPTGSDLQAGGFAVNDVLRREADYSADGVRRSIESSLQRLGLDRVDIVLVHDPDAHLEQTVAEAIPALVQLREQGVIDAVGVGMNQWQAPLQILARSDIDVVMIAGRWTLLDQSAQPLLDACQERGVGVLAAAPYNSGLLAHDWPPDDESFDYAPATTTMVNRARSLARTCQAHGTTLPDAALQFPLRHPAIASVVVGLASAEQVRSSVERLTADVRAGLWPSLAEIRPSGD